LFFQKETHKPGITPIEIPRGTINDMIETGKFSMPVTVRVSSELAETEVSMRLRSKQVVEDHVPISGFPRKLREDYKGNHLYLLGYRALLTLFLEDIGEKRDHQLRRLLRRVNPFTETR
jgi:hypothetical protein